MLEFNVSMNHPKTDKNYPTIGDWAQAEGLANGDLFSIKTHSFADSDRAYCVAVNIGNNKLMGVFMDGRDNKFSHDIYNSKYSGSYTHFLPRIEAKSGEWRVNYPNS